MPRTDFESELMKPVALEAGLVAIEWNDMCESFGLLFSTILYPKEPKSDIALAIWHSAKSDSLQREILENAARAALPQFNAFPKFYEDICFLRTKGTSLATHRNNVIHAPLTFEQDVNGRPINVVADTFSGNEKAKKLDGKDLIEAFRVFVKYAEGLKLFARNIRASITHGISVHSWPARPSLPSLAESDIPQVPQAPQNHK